VGTDTAPIIAIARKATAASGTTGMNSTTRSPRRTPSWVRLAAKRRTCASSSAKVSVRRSPSSPS
jgi:hypothetical protein